MRDRTTAALFAAIALLISLGWLGESWAQTHIPRLGVLSPSAMDHPWFVTFEKTLAEHGWVNGKNFSLEFRSARGDASRFAEAAQELVQSKVDVIFCSNAPAIRAAYAATHNVSLVALDYTTDPVAAGLAESYGHPGKNVTGVFLDAPELTGKWLEILRSMVPGLSRIAVLWDPAPGSVHLRAIESGAQSLGLQLQVLEVHAPEEIEKAFSGLHGRLQALIVLPSPLTYSLGPRLAELALKHRLPAVAMFRDFSEAGGTFSYGPDFTSSVQRSAVMVAKVLKGAKPGDLPIERPDKFELIVNSKTAKTLGLTIPESVLVRADEVIR